MQNDDEPKVRGSWPLVQLDADGRPRWHVAGTNPPEYDYDLRLEALWRAARREWVQMELWEMAA